MSSVGNTSGYNERVLAHFAKPVHAGDLQARYPVEVQGEAAEPGGGCEVKLSAGVSGHVYRELRHRVFGCPHLIAAAEEWCRRSEGRPLTAAPRFEREELMSLLSVPVEKAGRILLLEDAWLALCRHLDSEESGSTQKQ